MLRPEEAQRPYTVTELANEIRRELRPLTALLVKGEVSGMKRGAAGHFNFSIQDGVSRLDAVLFADEARRVTTLPEDGQVFIFRGRIDFFGKTGRLSFIVDQVEFDDVGKLRARLDELKRRLEAEGAFAPGRMASDRGTGRQPPGLRLGEGLFLRRQFGERLSRLDRQSD